MKKWEDMTDEEFEALPEEEKHKIRVSVMTTDMSDDDRAKMEWYEDAPKRAEEWDKTLRVLLERPKKKVRPIVLAIVLITVALVVILVVSG